MFHVEQNRRRPNCFGARGALFHVEPLRLFHETRDRVRAFSLSLRECQRTTPRYRLRAEINNAVIPASCVETSNRLFHVEQSARLLSHSADSDEGISGFLAPTSRNRRSDCGTSTGSRHSHPAIRRTSSRSCPPIQKITWFAAMRSDPAHLRNEANSPSAREHTASRGNSSSPSSSYRLTSTEVFLSPRVRTSSAKNVASFTLESTRNNCNSGRIIFKGTPGKPPPEPTSASRPPFKVIATAAYIDSQKWRSS